MLRQMDESRKWVIINALTVAADVYTQDAATADANNQPSVGEEFLRQAQNARKVAAGIEIANVYLESEK